VFTNLDALVELLTPWLNTSLMPSTAITQTNIHGTQVEPRKTLEEKVNNDGISAAIDLVSYAKHQGSPELAAFMLDDYIETIADMSEHLDELIRLEDELAIEAAMKEMKLTATILSAPVLIKLMIQIEQAFSQRSYKQMLCLIQEIKQELLLVKTFADAI